MASVISSVRQNNTRILALVVAIPGSVSENELNEGLRLAAREGYTECMECLLKAGADINNRNTSGETPLILAVGGNKLETVTALIKAGCDCDMVTCSRNAAIHVAVRKGLLECTKILLDNGVDINSRDSDENTLLIIAVVRKKYSITEELLSRPGCDIDAQNAQRWAALHYAAHTAAGVKLLLEAGANTNLYNEDGNTPLMLAAIEGFSKVIHLLTKAKCDVNMKDGSLAEKTAMHTIALKGHTECIEDMLEAGLDMNVFDNDYRTPLWYALNSGRYSTVESLLKFSGHVDSFHCPPQAPETSCPARLAFLKGAKQVIKQFILTGFDKDHIRQCLQSPEEFDTEWTNEDWDEWFLYIHQPLTLLQISRIWIRHHLGRLFYQNLEKLPLPKSFQDFLLMTEVSNVSV